MFDSLLIANRGEIACRIIRSARRLGVRTIAVYSDADSNALHVELADDAVHLGPAPAVDSYLNVERLLAAARSSGAQAIHPGYGFLSENAGFAQAVTDAGLVFVGPSAAVIETMGSKIAAKETVAAAGTPIVPGYLGADQSDARLESEALAMGFPLLIKASAGGGGKGMRIVESAAEFAGALAAARREAMAAFSDDKVLLERYLTAPKHLEVQILADGKGNTLHLFERDCSLQRRHQKVVEEAPGPTVSEALRERLGTAAVQAAEAVNYSGAGTVEFIAEGDEFYFMEMNTRLQVEHPVTEAITGLDLVAWQLRIAAGEPLPYRQEQLRATGHAIEVRLYAENPRRRFLPSSGALVHVAMPDNVRVDSGVRSGDEITPNYDPMLAKLIAHGKDRESARRQMLAALRRTELAGVAHNVDYLAGLIDCEAFRDGAYTTGTMASLSDTLAAPLGQRQQDTAVIAAQVAALFLANHDVWTGSGFRLSQPAQWQHRCLLNKQRIDCVRTGTAVCVNGRPYSLEDAACRQVAEDRCAVTLQLEGQRHKLTVVTAGAATFVVCAGATVRLDPWIEVDTTASGGGLGENITAPMPGAIITVNTTVGTQVAAGDTLVVMEAMKMEHALAAPTAGEVIAVPVAAGDKVSDGDLLVAIRPAGSNTETQSASSTGVTGT
ncbi:MAG: biotin carboxylase N-terminal domain-containing protein [Pseudomonadales bacterium]